VVGVVGPVPAGSAVAGDLAGDGGGRAIELPGDLGVPVSCRQPGGDQPAVLVLEPASRHRSSLCLAFADSSLQWAIAFVVKSPQQ
jgi:hypothetical protein